MSDFNFEVEFFVTNEGKIPVKAFLDSLENRSRAKASVMLSLLSEFGNDLREPYSKYIGDGIFELRIKQSNNHVRILYFFFTGKKIILTNGFIKKTAKTPPSEIKLAKNYKDEYYKRN